MRYALKIINPAVNYPVESGDMLKFLRIDCSDPAMAGEAAFVDDLIGAATSMLEELSGRAFITQTLELRLAPSVKRSIVAGVSGYSYESLPDIIKLWRPPCQSVTSVYAVDLAGATHLQAASNYSFNIYTEPAEIQTSETGNGWEYYVGGYYKIQYICGYGNTIDKVPPQIRNAIRLTVAQWYASRENLDYSVPNQAIDLLTNLTIEIDDL